MKKSIFLLLLSIGLLAGCSDEGSNEKNTVDEIVEEAKSPNDSTNEF